MTFYHLRIIIDFQVERGHDFIHFKSRNVFNFVTISETQNFLVILFSNTRTDMSVVTTYEAERKILF